MTRFLARAALALVGAVLWAAPSPALQPAPRPAAAATEATPAQFRFPWEAERKPQRRAKRTKRTEPNRARRPAEPRRAQDRRAPQKRPPAAAARPVDPMDARLPPRLAPLGLLPAGDTRREAESWAMVAAEAPPPAPVPLLPPEGPAPAPANVMALLAMTVPREPVAPAPPSPAPTVPAAAPDPDDDDDGPDLHVPLPPVRPPAPGEVAAATPREGLAPEGGLAPDSGLGPERGLAPEGVPLPPTRPKTQTAAVDPAAPPPPEPPGPTPPAIALPVTTHDEDPDCGALVDRAFAVAERVPPIEGPGVCGGGPLVSLTVVKRKDGGEIKVRPAATLRCGMAKAVADYLRDDLAPAAKHSGAELERLEIAGSFQCRGRNGAAGGKMSEHGRANAVDLSGFGLSDGKVFGIFASDLPQELAKAAKSGACERFSTVLGPGSDGFHESHLHIDLQPRRSKAKLCQWADPEVARAPGEDKTDQEGRPSGEDDAQKGDRPAADRARKAAAPETPLPKPAQTP